MPTASAGTRGRERDRRASHVHAAPRLPFLPPRNLKRTKIKRSAADAHASPLHVSLPPRRKRSSRFEDKAVYSVKSSPPRQRRGCDGTLKTIKFGGLEPLDDTTPTSTSQSADHRNPPWTNVSTHLEVLIESLLPRQLKECRREPSLVALRLRHERSRKILRGTAERGGKETTPTSKPHGRTASSEEQHRGTVYNKNDKRSRFCSRHQG